MEIDTKKAVEEMRATQERDDERYFLEKNTRRLNALFGGVKIIGVRHRGGDFELVLDNMKVLRFNPTLLHDL